MVSGLKRIFGIFRNEWRAVFADRGVLLVMAGAVFLYSLFYLVPFHNHIVRDIPVGVIDFDGSSLSRQLIRAFNANELLNVKTRPQSLAAAQEQYYRDDIRAFILIPRHFERDVKRGGHAFVTAYLDSTFLMFYKQLTTGVNEVCSALGAELEIRRLMGYGLISRQAAAVKTPFEFVQQPLFNPVGSYQNYIYPQVLIMILQQTMLIGIGMLGGTLAGRFLGFRRRHDGAAAGSETSVFGPESASAAEIVLGRSLAYMLLYLIYALAFLLLFPAFVTYHAALNIGPLLLIVLPFLFAVACLGQMLVLFCTTRESPFLLIIPTSVPLIFLSGFVWPREMIPVWLRLVSKIFPSTSAIDGLVKLGQLGADFSQVRDDFLILVLLSVLYFASACHAVKTLDRH